MSDNFREFKPIKEDVLNRLKDDDFSNYISKIGMEIEETSEAFIIKQIKPFCESIVTMELDKARLKRLLSYGKVEEARIEENKPTYEELERAFRLACKELSKRDSSITFEHISLPRAIRYQQRFIKEAKGNEEAIKES